jgi:hypothetical protein
METVEYNLLRFVAPFERPARGVGPAAAFLKVAPNASIGLRDRRRGPTKLFCDG